MDQEATDELVGVERHQLVQLFPIKFDHLPALTLPPNARPFARFDDHGILGDNFVEPMPVGAHVIGGHKHRAGRFGASDAGAKAIAQRPTWLRRKSLLLPEARFR